MPTPYLLTPRALNDFDEIWNFIADDNVNAANRVESAILSACNSLSRRPLLGSKRIDLTSLPVRFWTITRFPNFIVVYRPDAKPLQVVAILHGKRNIRAILGEPEVL